MTYGSGDRGVTSSHYLPKYGFLLCLNLFDLLFRRESNLYGCTRLICFFTQVGPYVVMSMLDDLFSRFDAAANDFGVLKVGSPQLSGCKRNGSPSPLNRGVDQKHGSEDGGGKRES